MDATVIDLDEFRTRSAVVPEEALTAVDDAWRTCAALDAQGHEVRFELPEPGGRVLAELRELSGSVVRAVGLRELVGWPEDPPAALAGA